MSEEVTKGIEELAIDEDKFKEHIDFMRSGYSYSYKNQLLLRLQGKQGVCRTFKQWKKEGYQVKKGSKGASLFRPSMVWVEKKDKNGNVILDKNGKPEKEPKFTGKYVVYGGVFSQNDLDDSVKEYPKNPLVSYLDEYMQRDDITYNQAMDDHLRMVAKDMNIPITQKNPNEDRTLSSGAYAYARKTSQGYEIVLSSEGKPHALTYNLAHEMGHILCGHLDKEEDSRNYHDRNDRSEQETEAEMVAYAIARDYGLDTDNSAFAYLKSWTMKPDRSHDNEKIEKALSKVSKGLNKYYSSLEKVVTGKNESEIRNNANTKNVQDKRNRS